VAKVRKNYYFNNEVIKHAENNALIVNFADWASEKYYEEFMTEDLLEIKLKELNKKTKNVQTQLNLIKKIPKRTILSIVSQKELLWISEVGIDAIKRTTLTGVYRRFIYKFNSVITKRQFMLTLSQLGFKGGKKW